jgi:tetratricopeptide (TPR) repeat protein
MSDPVAVFTRELLRYGRDIHAIESAAEAMPHDATVNAYAAAAALFAQTGDSAAKAAPFLVRARAVARERDDLDLVRAVAAWARGDLAEAIAVHGERLRRRPDDLAAARIRQLHQLDSGDSDGLLETVRLTLAADPQNHFLLGQLAFALEQVGDIEGSEAAARRALDSAADDDPWTHHAMAHALYARGDVEGGIAWIERHADLWERSNAFMHTHAWWHAAISHLDAERDASALAVYDERLRAACPNCVQSLVAAVSLLARLALRGADIRSRLADLADRLAGHAADRVNGFLDLHYLYGLALSGRDSEVAAMLADLSGTPADPGGRGLAAHAQGQFADAARWLESAAPGLHHLGGSHEQRDLYELVELDAALRSGRTSQARRLLARRVASRPSVAWQRRQLEALDRAAA